MAVGPEHDSRRGWLSLGFKVLLLLLITQIQWSSAGTSEKGKLCDGGDAKAQEGDILEELKSLYALLPLIGSDDLLRIYKGGFPKLMALRDDVKATGKPVFASSYTEIFTTEARHEQNKDDDRLNPCVVGGVCGFDIDKSYFQYICGDLSDQLRSKSNETLIKDHALPNGYLCNAVSGRFGKHFDEKDPAVKASQIQLTRTNVFTRLGKKGDDLIATLEKENSANCLEKNCKYSKDKHAFICGGQERSSIPLGVSVLAIGLILGIGSLPV